MVADMAGSSDSLKGRSNSQELDSLWRSYHNEILLLQPLSHVRQSLAGCVLDIGSGDGESLRLVGRFGIRGIGLDIKPSGRFSIKGTAIDLPFKDGSFETVICLRTLQHIRDEKSALREMRRVLKPKGFLIMSVANKRSFTMISLKSRGEWRGRDRIPYEWFKPYAKEELTDLLRSTGFEIIESDVVGFAPEILRRRNSAVSKYTMRVIIAMEKGLRALPVLGPMGSYVRVIARLDGPTSSAYRREP